MTATGAAALGTIPLAIPASAQAAHGRHPNKPLTSGTVRRLFSRLPGEVGIKLVAAPAHGDHGLHIAINSAKQMFVGSAIKTFVLGEALRRVDTPAVVSTLSAEMLALDESVWSLDSATFNPPFLSGKVSERTALEAMIMHSDNTGTDMCFKHVGPRNVRAFIAAAELRKTKVPDSTRVFFGYLLGAPNYKTFTWDDIVAAADDPIVNPPLNKVQTLASSGDDMVSYYSRALQGRFFRHSETLHEFRRILTLGDAISLLPVPLGVSAFIKGGSIDVPGSHALCVPGGIFFDNRWVYFSMTINWDAAAVTDPTTVAAFIAAARTTIELAVKSLSNR